MTSTISSNKERHPFLSVYLWSLRRHMGVGILYSILLFLALPLGVMLAHMSVSTAYSDNQSDSYRGLDPTIFQGFFAAAVTPIVLLFTLIVSAMLFSYLHKKRSADLFGALPLKRNSLLCAQLLSALTIILAPLILMWLLSVLWVPYDFSHNPQSMLFDFLLALLICVVSCLSFSLFCAVCAGTTFDMIVSILFLNIIYPAAVFLFTWFTACMLPGFGSGVLKATFVTALCPFGAVFDGYTASGGGLTAYYCWWAFFTVAMLTASLLLNRKRRAEHAETSFAYKAPALAIRFIATMACGIAFGWILSSIFYFGEKTNVLAFLIGLLIGSFVCHLILEAIYFRGFKGLKKSLIYYGAAALVTVVLYLSLAGGFFGYVTRVPLADEVDNVSISAIDVNAYDFEGMEDDSVTLREPENIQNVIGLHRQYIGYINATNSYSPPNPLNFLSGRGGYNITYHLKDGRTITRSYTKYYIDVNDSSDYRGNLLASSEYQQQAFAIFTRKPFELKRVNVYRESKEGPRNEKEFIPTPDQSAELLEALRSDFEGFTSEDFLNDLISYSLETNQDVSSNIYLSLYYKELNPSYGSPYDYFTVSSHFENTLRVLKKYDWDIPPAS